MSKIWAAHRHKNSLQTFVMLSALCFMVILFWPATAQAHRPGDMTLQYDPGSQTLRVTITHAVSNPSGHYVQKVTILKNGTLFKTFEYKSQPGDSTFTYTYGMEAQEGDTLKVTAKCSYFGSKTTEMTVGKAQ